MARPRGSSQSAKRLTQWVGAADQGTIAIATGSNVVHSSFAPSAFDMIRPTVVRTRGTAIFTPTAWSADLEFSGAYGLGVVSDQALAAGAGSIPRPFDDDDWGGWLVHGYYWGDLEFGSATGTHPWPYTVNIDSKAMRKVGVNESLVWMVESQVGAIQAGIHARVLLKLS